MKSRKSSRSLLKITSLEILHLVNELQKFVGKRVDNVHQDGSNFFLKISSRNGIEIRPDVIFASQGFDFSRHTGFSQLLNKHLKGRKITDIEQHNFDRIVLIKFGGRALVSELFHNGNLILCGDGMKIISALDQRHWKERSIMPGETYRFPAGTNISVSGEFMPGLDNGEKIVSFLVKNGLGFYAEEVLERCGILKMRECSSLSEGERKKLFAEIMSLLKREISVGVEDGRINLFGRGSITVSEAVQGLSKKSDFTVLDKQKASVKKMEEKERESRTKAEKIYEKFSEISSMPGKSEVEIDGITIKINKSFTLQKNAEKYFDEAKKIRGKIERAAVEMKKSGGKAAEEKPAAREWYHKFRWFFTSDGFLVIAGRDAKTNNDIIRRRLENSDIVIHAEIHGAAFAVVKCGKQNVTKNALEEAMQFAACQSKAWAMGLGTIDVYWVKPEQVSKQISGMGSFNIIGEKNYMRRMELKLGVGFVKGALEVLPHKTFENLCLKCVPVYTGSIKARELARKAKEKLKPLYIEKSAEIDGMKLDAIENRIPYGRGSI